MTFSYCACKPLHQWTHEEWGGPEVSQAVFTDHGTQIQSTQQQRHGERRPPVTRQTRQSKSLHSTSQMSSLRGTVFGLHSGGDQTLNSVYLQLPSCMCAHVCRCVQMCFWVVLNGRREECKQCSASETHVADLHLHTTEFYKETENAEWGRASSPFQWVSCDIHMEHAEINWDPACCGVPADPHNKPTKSLKKIIFFFSYKGNSRISRLCELNYCAVCVLWITDCSSRLELLNYIFVSSLLVLFEHICHIWRGKGLYHHCTDESIQQFMLHLRV